MFPLDDVIMNYLLIPFTKEMIQSLNIVFDSNLKKLLNAKLNYRWFYQNCYHFADNIYIQVHFVDGCLVYLVLQLNCQYVDKPLFETTMTKFGDAHVNTLAS